MKNLADVDIDIKPSSLDINVVFPEGTRASRVHEGKLLPHPAGVYLQDVPKDPVTGFCAIPYEEAEAVGLFKIDFLHLMIYENLQTRDEIKELLKIVPDWNLLQIPSVVRSLFQLGKQHELLEKVKPRSLHDMADVMALIRPGKIELLDGYLKDKGAIRPLLFQPDASGYTFKKSHAYAYATTVILQLNLIRLGRIKAASSASPIQKDQAVS